MLKTPTRRAPVKKSPSEPLKAAHFTRESPVTKVEIHNCFYVPGKGYLPRPVVEAKTVIGENAPKYLMKRGLVRLRMIQGVDYYCPTADGDAWLRNGLLRYLTLHPDRASACHHLPPGWSTKTAAKAAKAVQQPTRRLVVRTRAKPL